MDIYVQNMVLKKVHMEKGIGNSEEKETFHL